MFSVYEGWTACSRIGDRLNRNGDVIKGYLCMYKETFTTKQFTNIYII